MKRLAVVLLTLCLGCNCATPAKASYAPSFPLTKPRGVSAKKSPSRRLLGLRGPAEHKKPTTWHVSWMPKGGVSLLPGHVDGIEAYPGVYTTPVLSIPDAPIGTAVAPSPDLRAVWVKD